ncbi:MAG: hypothetical protein ABH896_00730 [Candidatus Jacksonbacteria bacterium]
MDIEIWNLFVSWDLVIDYFSSMHLDTRGHRKLKILITAVSTLFILILILILPAIEIKLKLKSKIFTKTYDITLDNSVKKPLPALNIIPAADEEYLMPFLISKISREISQDEKINLSKFLYDIKTKNSAKNEITVYVETVIMPILDLNQIKNQICGKKIRTVQNILSAMPEVEQAKIKTFPPKLFFAPLLKSRIKINEIDN